MTEFFKPHPGKSFTLPPEAKEGVAKKAHELYEKRIAPYAAGLSPANADTIIAFQEAILTADYYFEHTDKLDPNIIDSFWKQGERILDEIGVPKSVQSILFQEIKDYANIEIGTRKGKKLVDVDIEKFYFLKSSDVRMQRHLLRYLMNKPAMSSNEEIHKDMLEEVEDDIDDLNEDQQTKWSGNRLLEILNSGDREKLNQYLLFINFLPDAPQELVGKIRVLINQLRFSFQRKK